MGLRDLLAAASKQLGELNANRPTSQKDKQKAELRSKQAAKKAELKEGGKRAAERDWVASYGKPGGLSRTTRQPDQELRPGVKPIKLEPCVCPELVCELQTVRKPKQAPVQQPKPVAERSVDELYRLLFEKVGRLIKLNADPEAKPADRRMALQNADQIAELLLGKGETEEAIKDRLTTVFEF